MNDKHERYRTIGFEPCNSDCPKGGGPLEIILFRQEERLRSHAVNHLTNIGEYEDAWRDLVEMSVQDITKCTENLRALGCDYYMLQCDRPPCNQCRSSTWSRYRQCSDFVSNLENQYIGAVEKVVKEGGSIPRYACYSSRSDRSSFCWILPNRKLVAKAVLQGDIYNLMTCFYPEGRESWTEMRDYWRRELCSEALGYSIIWCREDTWGLSISLDNINSEHDEKQKKHRRPFFKQSKGGNWRKYLEESDE